MAAQRVAWQHRESRGSTEGHMAAQRVTCQHRESHGSTEGHTVCTGASTESHTVSGKRNRTFEPCISHTAAHVVARPVFAAHTPCMTHAYSTPHTPHACTSYTLHACTNHTLLASKHSPHATCTHASPHLAHMRIQPIPCMHACAPCCPLPTLYLVPVPPHLPACPPFLQWCTSSTKHSRLGWHHGRSVRTSGLVRTSRSVRRSW